MPKKREYSLDLIRILACFMVVLMHSPMPSVNAVGPFLTALSYFTAPCIGLFFMVSGALLLPIKTDYFTFLKRRFSKVIIPTVIWSLIYIALRLYYSESEITLWQQLCSIPFSAQGEGVLWFMYTLCGLYLLAPILSVWVENASQKELELVLVLWIVSLCYPLISPWLQINTSTTGILYYFSGYAGYFLLGYYLRRFPQSISTFICAIIAITGGILLLALKHCNIPHDFYSLFWYESIFIAAFAVAIWKCIFYLYNVLKLRRVQKEHLANISNLTFGIYLIHPLILRRLLWQIPLIQNMSNYVCQTTIIVVLTFTISTLVCHIISSFPLSQWITGYNKSSK